MQEVYESLRGSQLLFCVDLGFTWEVNMQEAYCRLGWDPDYCL
jgi:hypothetical protein